MLPAIELSNLSKRYRIRQSVQGKFGTDLTDEIGRWARSLAKGRIPRTEFKDFWGLRDVSMTIQPGESVGLVGRNGAGKSTLLKTLSRIVRPTSGSAILRGRIGSLLEVGTGFHQDLSGRENIFLAGAILGMSKFEVRSKFDEIVEFANIGEFVDTPVKRYSSGMYMRLAFAVAAHLETEILLVDEVLAVGDSQFQRKCLGKMDSVAKNGRTVVFVSHNMSSVASLCKRGIVLHQGMVDYDGPVDGATHRYLQLAGAAADERIWDVADAPTGQNLRLRAVRVFSEDSQSGAVDICQSVHIEVEYEVLADNVSASVSIHLLDAGAGVILASGNSPAVILGEDPVGASPQSRGLYVSRCTLPADFLNDKQYLVSVFLISDVARIEVSVPEAISFLGHDTGSMRDEFTGDWWGQIRPRLAWKTRSIGEGL